MQRKRGKKRVLLAQYEMHAGLLCPLKVCFCFLAFLMGVLRERATLEVLSALQKMKRLMKQAEYSFFHC
jgi:hypothetical protein